jgi:hypothetical protein
MEALPPTPAGYCGGWLAHLSSTQRASEVSEVPLSDGGTDGGAALVCCFAGFKTCLKTHAVVVSMRNETHFT